MPSVQMFAGGMVPIGNLSARRGAPGPGRRNRRGLPAWHAARIFVIRQFRCPATEVSMPKRRAPLAP